MRLQSGELRLCKRLFDLLTDEYVLTQVAFLEERLQIRQTTVDDVESLLLVCNLFGYGLDFLFNSRSLLLQDFELISIGFFEPRKNVVLGRINTLEINATGIEPNKQGHHKGVAFIPLRFQPRFANEQSQLIGFKLAYALLS